MSAFAYFVKITAFPFVYPFIKWKLIGKENLRGADNAVIAVKHSSRLDVVLLQYIFFKNSLVFPSSPTVFGHGKLIDGVIKKLGARFIDVSGRSLNGLDGFLDEDGTVCIFPEGRISKELLPFCTGAAYIAHALQKDILPVYINGNFGLFKRVRVVIGKKIEFRETVNDSSGTVSLKDITDLIRNNIELLSLECARR